MPKLPMWISLIKKIKTYMPLWHLDILFARIVSCFFLYREFIICNLVSEIKY